jgi:hypothetical protein
MSVLQGTDRERERKLILDGAWPHFPILPVKRYSDEASQEGLMPWRYVAPGREHTSGPWRVYLANLFALGLEMQEKGRPVTWAEALTDVPYVEYPTLDDFFDAGWRGD